MKKPRRMKNKDSQTVRDKTHNKPVKETNNNGWLNIGKNI